VTSKLQLALKRFFWILFGLGSTVNQSAHVFAQDVEVNPSTVIQNVRIIVGNGASIENGSLVFEDGLIVDVSEEQLSPRNALVIDATGKTIIPALIDAHSHVGYQGREDWGSHNYGVENLIDNLEQYAYYGFGAVFSAGSDSPAVLRTLESSRKSGDFTGARLLYAAGMAPPGQGPNNQFLTHAMAVEESFGETVLYGLETPGQARQQVRDAANNGISFIKIWVDDRGGSQMKLTPAIYRAVIDEAVDLGLKVFVHQQFASDMPDLIDAGAHGFLHGRIGTELDSDIANQAAASDVFIIPNLGLGELRREAIGDDTFLSSIFSVRSMQNLTNANSQRSLTLDRSDVTESELRESFRAMLQAGVDIVLGTDAGAVPDHPFGYSGHRELEIYVRLGMTPMQALVAATSVAAKHLGLDQSGQLKKDFRADFIVLDQNPLVDIRNTRNIRNVFLAGQEIDRLGFQQKWRP
jgi:imidazolonepropionase-like amidohydrolase